MATNQSNLIQACNDMNIIKLNGKLEITSEETAELDKEQFIEAVKKNIQLFGLHAWYYLPGPDGTMLNLCQDYHTFTLQEVINNYYIRAEEPPVTNNSSEVETQALNMLDSGARTSINFMTEWVFVLRLNHVSVCLSKKRLK